MPIFTPRPLAPDHPLPDAAGDYKTALRAEQIRFSAQALYFPAFPGIQYLSFRALTAARTRNTSLSLTGSCGKALPVICLRLFFGQDQHRDVLFEKASSAAQVLEAIAALRPELPIDRETRPQCPL
ncbi:MAG: hypothetical protein HFG00_10740 [Oscillibacter sp.]|nr:hypothetical protein [Oscillibacter sp.]